MMRGRALVYAVIVLACCCPARIEATSGGLLELPVSPSGALVYSRQSDLDLRLDTTWAGIHGYRPISCTVSARSPQTADRQIMIRFFAGNFRNDQPSIVVKKHFELPAGKLSASTKMLVPQFVEWRSIGCETWVDGVKDEELSMNQLPFAISQGGQNYTALLLNDMERIPWRLFRDIRGGPAEVFDSPTGELFERWTEYSTFDVVVTTPGDLRSVHERYPERFPELLKWIRAGGNLWICSVGKNYEQVPEVEGYLDVENENDTPVTEGSMILERGWRFPKVDNTTGDALAQYSELYSALETENEVQSVDQDTPVDSRQWFAVRPLGMGTVTVFAAVEWSMSRRDAREITWNITQSLLGDRLSWEERHGTDPDKGNENFNDFLIPDVGAAPVTAFQVLLSLFVLGIGPLNYFVLKSREKLPLLLVTVPLAAAATTLLLLTYAFTSEGLGTLVRARSFTLLDQESDTAASWTRLSYFAGMAPAEGLKFPADTLVYPILPSMRMGDHREQRRIAGQRRDLVWDGQQKLTRGWLASRTPTQYLTVTSRETKKEIAFEGDEERLTAKNNLGVDVLTLVVEDHAGNVFVSEKIANGKSVELSPSTQIKAMLVLRPLLANNAPQFPVGTYETLPMYGGVGLMPFSQNLMETQLSAITSAVSKGWGPGSYIAITDRGMEISLGLDEITENSSFHVVRGVW